MLLNLFNGKLGTIHKYAARDDAGIYQTAFTIALCLNASTSVRTVPEAFCFQAVCACICDHILSLLTRYVMNCLSEFHHSYNFGAVGDKNELIRF